MNHLTQGFLALNHEVTILAMNTPKTFININELPESYRKATKIMAVFVDTGIKPIAALLNLFTPNSYNIERFISKSYEHALIQILKNNRFDIVQLESLFLTPYLEIIRNYSNSKVVLRAHNIEFEIWERRTKTCRHLVKKWYLKLLSRRLKNYELSHLNKYDGIAAISKRDANHFIGFGCNKPITEIPIGVDLTKGSISLDDIKNTQLPNLFHLGSMDWMPNKEAIGWFLEEVWPLLHKLHPDMHLFLAGNNMPDHLINMGAKNIHVEGYIKDADAYMSSKDIMIVPLLSGSGMRVKIIEGMALGKAIVSTSIGAEGINYIPNKHLLIADDAPSFADAISRCVKERELIRGLGENARLLIKEKYDNTVISKKLEDFYIRLLK
jgi:glycosyltransferase involved in cell wall biosynthesis